MQPCAGGVEFLPTHIVRAEEQLTMQVGVVYHIAVDERERANTSRGEIHRGRRTEPTHPHDQHARRSEALLSSETEAAQRELACVAGIVYVDRHYFGVLARPSSARWASSTASAALPKRMVRSAISAFAVVSSPARTASFTPGKLMVA